MGNNTQRPSVFQKDSAAVLDKKVTRAINELGTALSRPELGNTQRAQKAIQDLKKKNILNPKETSTLSKAEANPKNLAKHVDSLMSDARVQKLPQSQQDALEAGFDKLRKKKILKDSPAETIEP